MCHEMMLILYKFTNIFNVYVLNFDKLIKISIFKMVEFLPGKRKFLLK